MFYCIYKITNKIDGKIYIGSHKTENLDDTYMGSGKYLKRAQKKYGIENFTKEILFVFDTPEQMYAKEAEIVNEEFLITENTYNLKVGGFGGWDHINTKDNPYHSKEHMSYISSFQSLEEKLKCAEKARKAWNNKLIENGGKLWYKVKWFSGKTHSDETKKKIGEHNSKAQSGSGNSQFGTMWITNEKDNMKIPKDGIIPTGWRKGRKINAGLV